MDGGNYLFPAIRRSNICVDEVYNIEFVIAIVEGWKSSVKFDFSEVFIQFS